MSARLGQGRREERAGRRALGRRAAVRFWLTLGGCRRAGQAPARCLRRDMELCLRLCTSSPAPPPYTFGAPPAALLPLHRMATGKGDRPACLSPSAATAADAGAPAAARGMAIDASRENSVPPREGSWCLVSSPFPACPGMPARLYSWACAAGGVDPDRQHTWQILGAQSDHSVIRPPPPTAWGRRVRPGRVGPQVFPGRLAVCDPIRAATTGKRSATGRRTQARWPASRRFRSCASRPRRFPARVGRTPTHRLSSSWASGAEWLRAIQRCAPRGCVTILDRATDCPCKTPTTIQIQYAKCPSRETVASGFDLCMIRPLDFRAAACRGGFFGRGYPQYAPIQRAALFLELSGNQV